MFEATMRLGILTTVLAISFPCHATDTLDCTGNPYSATIHVGYDEDGNDFLADVMLYKDGSSDPVAIYRNKDLEITLFKWLGDESGNMMRISSRPESAIPLKLDASDGRGAISVYEIEYSIRCHWER